MFYKTMGSFQGFKVHNVRLFNINNLYIYFQIKVFFTHCINIFKDETFIPKILPIIGLEIFDKLYNIAYFSIKSFFLYNNLFFSIIFIIFKTIQYKLK